MVFKIGLQIIVMCLMFIFHSCGFAQNKYLFNDEVFIEKKFAYTELDSVSYLINSTKYDISKPSVIFFKGSLPVPLIIKWDDGELGMVPFTYFNFSKFLDNFNLILVSKPFIPVCVEASSLVNSCYVPDTTQPKKLDSNYMRTDNLNYLGKRGDSLVNWLLKSGEINANRIITIGHSQGGSEAVRVAKLNKNVTDVVMLGASPYGRAQQVISYYYLKYIRGEIDFKTYLNFQNLMSKSIQEEYIGSNSVSFENPRSFYEYSFTDMLGTSANILYAAGTNDIASFYAGQVLIDSKCHGKNNVEVKLYEDRDHSFFKVDSSGVINREIDSWQEVFDDVSKWFNQKKD